MSWYKKAQNESPDFSMIKDEMVKTYVSAIALFDTTSLQLQKHTGELCRELYAIMNYSNHHTFADRSLAQNRIRLLTGIEQRLSSAAEDMETNADSLIDNMMRIAYQYDSISDDPSAIDVSYEIDNAMISHREITGTEPQHIDIYTTDDAVRVAQEAIKESMKAKTLLGKAIPLAQKIDEDMERRGVAEHTTLSDDNTAVDMFAGMDSIITNSKYLIEIFTTWGGEDGSQDEMDEDELV